MQPEFSRKLDCQTLGAGSERHDIEANADERAALARRFGVERLDTLSARLTVSALGGGRVRLEGRLGARVVQNCVVTLAPVEASVEEDFIVLYGPEASPDEGPKIEVDLPLDDQNWPEPMSDGVIDLGEAVAQHLSLALDPYPRAPGAEFESGREPEKNNPFKALAEAGRKDNS